MQTLDHEPPFNLPTGNVSDLVRTCDPPSPGTVDAMNPSQQSVIVLSMFNFDIILSAGAILVFTYFTGEHKVEIIVFTYLEVFAERV